VVSTEHFLLDLICEDGEVSRQPVEQLPLRSVGGEVPDQGAIGRVPAELFQLSLIVLHGTLPFAAPLFRPGELFNRMAGHFAQPVERDVSAERTPYHHMGDVLSLLVIASVGQDATSFLQGCVHVGDSAGIQPGHGAYLGGCNPGERSHSLMCEPVSACLAFRSNSSLSAPCGSNLASSRKRFASKARRSSRGID